MNKSFRTAFWAMCLGLTVPMVLFIGVELTPGGRAARRSILAANEYRGSLRGYWSRTQAKLAARESAGQTSRGTNGSSPPPEALATPRTNTRRGNPASAADDPKVVLGPLLESDAPPSESEGGRDRRVPAVVTGRRPSIEVLRDPPEPEGDSRPIGVRLDGIEEQLARLGRTIAAQSQREPAPDLATQTAELLRQARDGEEPVAQIPRLSAPETDVESEPIVPEKKGVKDAEPGAAPAVPLNEADRTPRRSRSVTKIYYPRYLSGSALQALVEPLLTEGIGKVGAADAGTDASAQAAGGDQAPAPVSALVVRELPEVLRKIDRLVLDLDIPPLPVVIEATVVTVRLNGSMPHGIDLQEFNTTGQPFVVLPADGQPFSRPSSAGPPSLGRAPASALDGPLLTHGFGLKCGVLHGDPRAFISVVQAATQTLRVNAWQLNVLNRQSAQLMLNDPFGPEGLVAQSSTGTILKVRPIVTQKGLVHLDVQREVDLDAAASGSRSAALTSQIALQEGQTAVVGGFFAEYLAAYFYRTPGIGQVPLVGRLFRKQASAIERCETIILLTPHVIRSGAEPEPQTVRKDRPKLRPAGRPILKTAAGDGAGRGRTPAAPRATAPLGTAAKGSSRELQRPKEPRAKPPVNLPKRPPADIVRTGGSDEAGDSVEPGIETIPVLELPDDDGRPLIVPALPSSEP